MDLRFIMLPDDPDFYDILHSSLPPTQLTNHVYVARQETGILEAVGEKELGEYFSSGEFDQVQDQLIQICGIGINEF
jgi:hypothetical protein